MHAETTADVRQARRHRGLAHAIHALGLALGVGLVITLSSSSPASADTAKEIDKAVDEALRTFAAEVDGGQRMLNEAKGVLVFPRIVEAALGVGGEYGEGALRVDGVTTGYYNRVSASFGPQIGGQSMTIILLFFDDKELARFRTATGWQIGVDAKVTLLTVGAAGELTTKNFRDPVVAVVLGERGLMAGVSLEGGKITKIKR